MKSWSFSTKNHSLKCSVGSFVRSKSSAFFIVNVMNGITECMLFWYSFFQPSLLVLHKFPSHHIHSPVFLGGSQKDADLIHVMAILMFIFCPILRTRVCLKTRTKLNNIWHMVWTGIFEMPILNKWKWQFYDNLTVWVIYAIKPRIEQFSWWLC